MNQAEEVTAKLLRVIPLPLRQIRKELRALENLELTIPQFHLLQYIDEGYRHVSVLAELHGVSKPAMSRMANGLVDKNLISRMPKRNDRRHIIFYLTENGKRLYKKARRVAKESILQNVRKLEPEEYNDVLLGITALERVFGFGVGQKNR